MKSSQSSSPSPAEQLHARIEIPVVLPECLRVTWRSVYLQGSPPFAFFCSNFITCIISLALPEAHDLAGVNTPVPDAFLFTTLAHYVSANMEIININDDLLDAVS